MRSIEIIDILRYYVAYKDIEEPILIKLAVHEWNFQESAFKTYVNSYMAIGRNFKTGTNAMVYNITKDYFMEGNSMDVDELSNRFHVNNLLNNKIRKAKVAASKLIWLFDKESIIMDNLNRQVLDVKSDTYQDFCIAWNVAFKKVEPEIIAITQSHNLVEIDPIMNERWFRMRVFDQYLWTLGK